jgi:transcriptional regulator with XRE-family HTH domain
MIVTSTSVPNDRLAAARAAARLTQEALAELANAQVEQATGRAGAMDADYVSKLERGIHRWPGKHYRRALRDVLGAQSDLDLGFYSMRSMTSKTGTGLSLDGTGHMPGTDRGSDEVKRQAFLRGLATTVTGMALGDLDDPVAEAVGRAASDEVPSQVGPTEVQQVEHATNLFGEWQDLYGGGSCKDAIAAQVRWATGLFNASATDDVRTDLYRSVGFLVDVAGWGAFDAADHDKARRYFRLALYCAEQAKDWGLRANVLSDMARQAMYVGQPDDGLSLIELAQVRQDRQQPTVRAMLSTVHARTLAKVGRREECYGAVLAAEDQFTNRTPGGDPPWIAYFHGASLASDAGHALFDVALAGDHIDDARRRLIHAVEHYSAEQARGLALSLGRLAILELNVGDPERGIVYGEQALAAAPSKSRRVLDDLTEIRRALGKHIGAPGAAELRSRVAHALMAG